jgi:hypothetical protein
MVLPHLVELFWISDIKWNRTIEMELNITIIILFEYLYEKFVPS